LQLGEAPEDSRKANDTSVFKKGKKEDPGNYRLVSLTLIPGKMMKQLILKITSKHMKDKKVIRISHHGFTKRKTCLINLILFYDEMAGLTDEGRAYHLL